MVEIRWDSAKNESLKESRDVSFEEIIQSKWLGIIEHPTRPHQSLILFEHKGYVWVAPCVETETEIFLKTLFPSRKYTALYRKGKLYGYKKD